MKLTLWKTFLFLALNSLTVSAMADWQCFASDVGGHTWTSVGTTEERANAVAMSFCSSYSPDGSTCHTARCDSK